MIDPVPTPAELPRALLVALMAEAARAVATVNGAIALQLAQPAPLPAESEAWRATLVQVAFGPLYNIWTALEPAQLPAAGAHVILALLREMTATASAGIAVLRQFATPLPATEPASPPLPAVGASPGPGSPI
ncbi:MAG: hypothetical protein Q7W02_02320 [Candidatus Rokubacteria bacterium]|nr:hypothetical protein [Candidatus Rokubacteria bacterium]